MTHGLPGKSGLTVLLEEREGNLKLNKSNTTSLMVANERKKSNGSNLRDRMISFGDQKNFATFMRGEKRDMQVQTELSFYARAEGGC